MRLLCMIWIDTVVPENTTEQVDQIVDAHNLLISVKPFFRQNRSDSQINIQNLMQVSFEKRGIKS